MIKRWQEDRLNELMAVRRGVNLTGARQVGKTTLAGQYHAARERRFTFDDPDILAAALSDPKGFVRHAPGETLIIDEVQKAAPVLNGIKMALDQCNDRSQYLITGSSNLRFAKEVKDLLAGRLGVIRLRSLAVGEIAGGRPDFVTRAFEGRLGRQYPELDKRGVIHLAFQGGYPECLDFSPRERRAWFVSYLNDILNKDVQDLTEIRKLDVLQNMARWLLAHSAQFFSIEELATKSAISKETAENYLEALRALYLFDKVPAWSKSDYDFLGKRPKWLATDAALVANLLGWEEEQVYLDEKRNGKFVETWVYQQLAAICGVEDDWSITHYRDGRKREIDFMLERPDGATLGIEVKAGSVSKSDFKHLEWFRDNLAKESFVGIVLYSGSSTLGFGDRLYAVPLAALRG